MTWVRLDDQFPRHPKLVRAGGDAAWLYVCGLCYCAEHLTDGLIPKEMLTRLSDRKRPTALARVLVDQGLWEDEGDAWLVHDYLTFQPSRNKVVSERAASAERMRNSRRSSGGVAAQHETNGPVDNSQESGAKDNNARTTCAAKSTSTRPAPATPAGVNTMTTPKASPQVAAPDTPPSSAVVAAQHEEQFDRSSTVPSSSRPISSYPSSSELGREAQPPDGDALLIACQTLARREAAARTDLTSPAGWIASRTRSLVKQHADTASRMPGATPAQLVAYLDGSRPPTPDPVAVAATKGTSLAGISEADANDVSDACKTLAERQAFMTSWRAAQSTNG